MKRIVAIGKISKGKWVDFDAYDWKQTGWDWYEAMAKTDSELKDLEQDLQRLLRETQRIRDVRSED